jgi:hypothetical protein
MRGLRGPERDLFINPALLPYHSSALAQRTPLLEAAFIRFLVSGQLPLCPAVVAYPSTDVIRIKPFPAFPTQRHIHHLQSVPERRFQHRLHYDPTDCVEMACRVRISTPAPWPSGNLRRSVIIFYIVVNG